MRPRRLQITVRALFLCIAVLALPLSAWVNQAHRQRRAVDAIQKVGGRLTYRHEIDTNGVNTGAQPPGPDWLRRIMGDEYFLSVVGVTLYGNQAVDANLEPVRQLKELQFLAVWAIDTNSGRTRGLGPTPGAGITDKGLGRLNELTELRRISLFANDITDDGLKHFKSFPKLTSLQIDHGRNSRVTKKGIEELRKALPQLRGL